MNKVYNLDARLLCEIIHEEVIDVTITSPPYHNLKDYGSKNQIGFGQSYEDYLNDLETVFQKVFEKTKSTGSLWVIIDAYRKDKEVVPLPFDFARRMQNIGWKFKDIIIWNKDRTVPWAHKGQMRKMFEFILLFSKKDNYKFYIDRVREKEQLKNWWIKYPERYNPSGKTPEEIWSFPIPTQGSWGQGYISHFCPLPGELVKRIIMLSTDEGDLVLDPFAGTGTVPSQAAFSKRKYVGFELNKKYIKMFLSYLKTNLADRLKQYEDGKSRKEIKSKPIIDLRVLKYCRELLRKFEREITLIYCDKEKIVPTTKYKLVKANYYILINSSTKLKSISKKIVEYSIAPPLSKYGIETSLFFYTKHSEFVKKIPKSKIYCYKKTNSHKYSAHIFINNLKDEHKILSTIKVNIDEKV